MKTQVDSAPSQLVGDRRAAYVLPWVVLVFGVFMALSSWWMLREREVQIAEQNFEADVQHSMERIREQLVVYEVMLRSGSAMLGMVQTTNPQLWARYVHGLQLQWRFPALTGVGYAAAVDPAGLRTLQMQQHESGRSLFSIRPAGVRPLYAPIVYLEPATEENQRVLGYDMLSESVREQAMLTAGDSGLTRLSGPVQLQQEQSSAPVAGLLLYAPVYTGSAEPSTTSERRRLLRGWVYTPFRAHRLFESALDGRVREHLLRIKDVTDPATPQLLMEDDGFQAQLARREVLVEQVLDIHGRHWQVQAVPRAGNSMLGNTNLLNIALAGGLATAGLLFMVAWLLARMRGQAHALAVRMSESSRRSEQRFRSALAYSLLGTALLDRDGVILEANASLSRIVGVPEHALAGTVLASYFSQRLEPQTGNGDDTEIGGVQRMVRRLRHADGSIRMCKLVFTQIPTDDSERLDRLVEVEDITEQLEAEAHIRNLNRTLESRVVARTRELQLANEEMEAFAYSVSHDLRAPLRAINGFSQLLRQRHAPSLNDDANGYLERVSAAAKRMDELIDAMLQLARVGRNALQREPLDISAMANDVVAGLRASDPDRQVDIRIAPNLQAVGDRSLIANVLDNLIGNAWKFSSCVADARIEVGRDEQGWLFVRDNGAGFDPAFAAKLFQPFQRLHSQSQFSGHGIGLTTVKRIIERHGGSIEADAAVGQGALFKFTLPDVPSQGH